MKQFYLIRKLRNALLLTVGAGLLATAANAQTVLFSENFSSVTLPTTPPTGWTNNNITGFPGDVWHFDNPGSRGPSSPIAAPFAVFDSRDYSNNGLVEIVALESDTFNTTGYGIVKLKWDQYYRDDPSSIGYVEVWNGITWIAVYSVNANTPTHEHQDIDISASAANRSGVRVRFRYTGDHSQYWIVDNISVTGNSVPTFVGGTTQSLSLCENSPARSINTLMAVYDMDAGQTETWAVTGAPSHGTVAASYSVTSTGSTLTPTGLTYTPTAGFVGTDAFTVTVTDQFGASSSTTVNVTVNPLPAAITGTTEFCEGAIVGLATSSTGGTWSSSAPAIATVGTSGAVTGVLAGTASIVYTLPTSCSISQDVTVNPIPAAITGTTVFCEGATSAMATTSTGGLWASSDYSVASIGTDGVVSGVAAGTAIITYRLPTGCLTTQNVTVNPLPAAIVGLSNVCEGSTITLTNAITGGSWTSSNSAVAAIGSASGIVSGVSAGSVVVSYILPTSCSRSVTVSTRPLPVVYAVNGGGSYCEGGAGSVVGMANSESGYTYRLYNGATLSSTHIAAGGAFNFGPMPAAGTYTATATTGFGCVSDMSASATVVITPTVAVTVSVATTPGDTVCAGTLNTFTATPVNGGTTPGYVWRVNGSLVSTTTDTFQYTPVAGDVVEVTLTSSAVCPMPASVAASKSVIVVSNETPVATIAAYLGSVPLAVNDSVCQGSTVNYYASTVWGGDAPSLTWYKNGVATTTTGSSYTYIPVIGDTITVKLNSNYRCPIVNNVTSNKIGLRVDSIYMPILIINTNTGLSVKTGTSVTFTGTVLNGGPVLTYQWYKNSSLIVGATTNTYTTSSLANGDSVSCWVTSIGNCAWYSFNAVKVKVSNDVQTLTEALELTLAPNPNTGDFYITGTLGSFTANNVDLVVTNMLGQTVFTQKVAAASGLLNERITLSSALPNGIYLLNVQSGDQRQTFRFMIKQ
ncbi:MAG: T9SS type A sorting domain-containing protein [Flavipsychrobacter sp.]|nr:T9SS type A sorting domain-containing protein [Flavipsychrobacter sp.]